MKSGKFHIVLVYLVLIVIFIFISGCLYDKGEHEKVNYDDIIQYFHNDEIIEFEISERDEITLTLTDEAARRTGFTIVKYKLSSLKLYYDDLHEYALRNIKPNGNLVKWDILEAP